MGGLSAGVAAEAQGRAVTLNEVIVGASLGALTGGAGAYIPGAVAVAGSLFTGVSIGTFGPILFSSTATYNQKVAATTMIVTGIWGMNAGLKYANAAQNIPPQGANANPPALPQDVPQFPLPLRAPPGITLKSMQPGLRGDKIWQIPGLIKSMETGTAIPRIGGYKQGSTYYIGEGNHRVAAALEFYSKTGNPGPLMNLLNAGKMDPGVPSQASYDMTGN